MVELSESINLKKSKNYEKPRIAFFSFTGCEGCQFSILESPAFDIEWLFNNFDIAEFRLLRDKKSSGPLDIAFVEGAISRDEEEKELREVRKRAKYLIPMGACAVIGGVIGRLNGRPVNEVVEVDYVLRGCPINPKEFFYLLHHYLEKGKFPEEKKLAVCTECPLRGKDCLLHNGKPCLGPITYAGCGALCPKAGVGCEGCRGILPQANLKGFMTILRKVADDEKITNMLLRYQKRLPSLPGEDDKI